MRWNAILAVVLVLSLGGVSMAADPVDTVWVEDSVPAGAITTSSGWEPWTWVGENPSPTSGALAHQSPVTAGTHQHCFYYATAKLDVYQGDTVFAYVYLDPTNPPTEVMLQWRENGSWEHRAYWGANSIAWGTNGTASRRFMGALPATGQWVRLEVPAADVGLEGKTLDGMAFTLYGGAATWDKAGKNGRPATEVVWGGAGADENWTTAANWVGGFVPRTVDVAVFDGTSSKNCTINAGATLNGLKLQAGYAGVVSAGAQAITVNYNSGNGLLLVAGGELKLGSATHTIKGSFTQSGGTITAETSTVQFLAPDAASVDITGDVVLNGVKFFHSNSGSNHKTVNINGTVTANGRLEVNGYAVGGWYLYLNGGGEIIAKGEIVGNGKVVRGNSNLTVAGYAGNQDQTNLWWGSTGLYTVDKPVGTLVYKGTERFGDSSECGNCVLTVVSNTPVDATTYQPTVELCTYGHGDVTVQGNMTVHNLTFYRFGGTGTTYYNLSGGTLTVQNETKLNVAASGGWYTHIDNGTVDTRGNLTIQNNNYAWYGTALMKMTGSADAVLTGGGLSTKAMSIEVAKSAGATVTLAGDLSLNYLVNDDLTVTSGRLNLAGKALRVGALSVGAAGTLKLNGDEAITKESLSLAAGSTVEYAGAGSYASLLLGNVYSNLKFVGAGTYTLGADLDVNGVLTLAGGTLNDGGRTINLAGDWANTGGVLAATGAVVLDGENQAISGSTTFKGLSKSVLSARTLTFEAGSTQTVTGVLALQGVDVGLLSLRSTAIGQQWRIDPQDGRSLAYLDVKDSNNINATAINVLDAHCVDSGNNTNWIISGAPIGTWVGLGADNNWTTAGNWAQNVVPGAGVVAVFSHYSSKPCVLDANVTVDGIRLESGYAGVVDAGTKSITVNYAAGSGVLSVAGGELKLGSATHTIKGDLTYTGGLLTAQTSMVQFLAPDAASIDITGDVVLNGVKFYHSNSGSNHKTVNINGTVTANGRLEVNGYAVGGWYLYLNGSGEIIAKGEIVGNGKVVRGNSNLTVAGSTGNQDQTNLWWGSTGLYTVDKPVGTLVYKGTERFGDSSECGNCVLTVVSNTPVDATTYLPTVELCTYGHGDVTVLGDLTVHNLTFYRFGGTGTTYYSLSGGTITVLNETKLNVAASGGWYTHIDNGTVDTRGNLTIQNDNYAWYGTALMKMTGSADALLTGGGLDTKAMSIEVAKSAGATVTLAGDLSLSYLVNDDLTVTSGRLNLAGRALRVGALSVGAAGTLKLNGDESITRESLALATGSTVEYGGAGTYGSLLLGNAYSNLKFVGTGTYTLGADLDVNGALTLAGGTLSDGGRTINLAGDWAKVGGVFSATGLVVLDGADQVLTGATTFNNLTKTTASARMLTLDAVATQTVTGALTLQGAEGGLLGLRSNSVGQQWGINPQGARALAYLDVKDSNNINATAIDVTDNHCVDSGNNTGWTFQGGANQPPVANNQSVTTDEDTAVAVTLTGSDPESSPLTFTVTVQPQHGTLSGTAPALTYTPAANWNGSDSFAFKVNDGQLGSADATVSITVTPVNDAPVAASATVAGTEDTVLAITLAGSDVENSALTYAVVSQPTHGTLSGTAPALTYAPEANWSGTDTFRFKVNDGELDSAEAVVTVEIAPVNDLPVAVVVADVTAGRPPLTVSFDGGWSSDVEGAIVSYSWSFGDGQTGTGAQVTHVYGAVGTYVATLTVTDGAGATAQDTVEIAVAWNDAVAPEITGLVPVQGSFTKDSTPVLSALWSDAGSGINLGAVAIVLDGQNITGAAAPTASGFSYELPAGSALTEGQHTLAVSVADNAGNVVQASAVFTVDLTLPVVANLSPESGSHVRSSMPAIGATYTDGLSGILPSQTHIWIDGVEVTGQAAINSGAVVFTPAGGLTEGGHTAVVFAGDAAGNVASVEWTFFVDTVGPAVGAIAVSPAEETNAPRPTFSGSFIESGSGVASVVVKVDGQAIPVSVAGSGYTATPAVDLAEDDHLCVVTVTDLAGNVGSNSKSFVTDYTPPGMPAVGTLDATVDRVTISGGTDADVVEVLATATGALVESAVVQSYTVVFRRPEGGGDDFTYTLRFRDRAGNLGPIFAGSASFAQETSDVGLSEVALYHEDYQRYDAVEGYFTNKSIVRVVGVVTGGKGPFKVLVSAVGVGGARSAGAQDVEDGAADRFDIKLKLYEGATTVNVEVRDAEGRTASAAPFSVALDRLAPEIKVVLPAKTHSGELGALYLGHKDEFGSAFDRNIFDVRTFGMTVDVLDAGSVPHHPTAVVVCGATTVSEQVLAPKEGGEPGEYRMVLAPGFLASMADGNYNLTINVTDYQGNMSQLVLPVVVDTTGAAETVNASTVLRKWDTVAAPLDTVKVSYLGQRLKLTESGWMLSPAIALDDSQGSTATLVFDTEDFAGNVGTVTYVINLGTVAVSMDYYPWGNMWMGYPAGFTNVPWPYLPFQAEVGAKVNWTMRILDQYGAEVVGAGATGVAEFPVAGRYYPVANALCSPDPNDPWVSSGSQSVAWGIPYMWMAVRGGLDLVQPAQLMHVYPSRSLASDASVKIEAKRIHTPAPWGGYYTAIPYVDFGGMPWDAGMILSDFYGAGENYVKLGPLFGSTHSSGFSGIILPVLAYPSDPYNFNTADLNPSVPRWMSLFNGEDYAGFTGRSGKYTLEVGIWIAGLSWLPLYEVRNGVDIFNPWENVGSGGAYVLKAGETTTLNFRSGTYGDTGSKPLNSVQFLSPGTGLPDPDITVLSVGVYEHDPFQADLTKTLRVEVRVAEDALSGKRNVRFAVGSMNTTVPEMAMIVGGNTLGLDVDRDGEVGTGAEDADRKFEDTPGGWVLVNDDNDNRNVVGGVPQADMDEAGEVSGEDDLVRLKVILPELSLLESGDSVTLSEASARVRVWRGAERGTQVSLPATWYMYDSEQRADLAALVAGGLWVEGVRAGEATIGLTVDSTLYPASDTVKLTVIPSHNEGTATGSPGAYGSLEPMTEAVAGYGQVNLTTGNLVVGDSLPMGPAVYFNSRAGEGLRTSYDMRVAPLGADRLLLVAEDGRRVMFKRDAAVTGRYLYKSEAQLARFEEIEARLAEGKEYPEFEEYVLKRKSNAYYFFDGRGMLSAVRDLHGGDPAATDLFGRPGSDNQVLMAYRWDSFGQPTSQLEAVTNALGWTTRIEGSLDSGFMTVTDPGNATTVLAGGWAGPSGNVSVSGGRVRGWSLAWSATEVSFQDALARSWTMATDSHGRVLSVKRPDPVVGKQQMPKTISYNDSEDEVTVLGWCDATEVGDETKISKSVFIVDSELNVWRSFKAWHGVGSADNHEAVRSFKSTGGGEIRLLADEQDFGGDPASWVWLDNGNLQSHTDVNGKTWTYTWTDLNLLDVDTSPMSRGTDRDYEPDGDLSVFKDGRQRQTGYTSDQFGRVLTTTLPEVNGYQAQLTNEYQMLGLRVLATRHAPDVAVDVTTESLSTPMGWVVMEKDERGKYTQRAYDQRGNVLFATGPRDALVLGFPGVLPADGDYSKWEYYADDRVKSYRGRNGQVTNSVYDGLGRLVETYMGTEAAKIDRVTMEYDGRDNLVTRTVHENGEAKSYATGFESDRFGRTMASTPPGGASYRVQYGYTPKSFMNKLTDATLQDWKTDFFKDGKVQYQYAPGDTQRVEFGYDDDGIRNKVKDATNVEVTQAVWPDGMLKSVSNAFGTRDFDYNGLGQGISSKDPDGRVNALTTNSCGWALSRSSGTLGTTVPAVYTYAQHQPDGTPNKVIAPGNFIQLVQRNAKNLVTSETLEQSVPGQPASVGQGYQYFPDGASKAFVDAAGKSWSVTRDHRNRVITESIPNAAGTGSVTLVERKYGARGELQEEKVTDRSGYEPVTDVTEYFYHLNGWLLCVRRNGLNFWTARDANGQVEEEWEDNVAVNSSLDLSTVMIGARVAACIAGRVTHYVRNAAGQVTSKLRSVPDGQGSWAFGEAWTYGYDAAGRQNSATDPLGHTTTTEYDAAGRMKKVTDALGHYIQNEYYPSGLLWKSRDKNGRWTVFTYDGRGRMTSRTNPMGHAITYEYTDDPSTVTVSDPDGGKVRRTMDMRGNVVKSEIWNGSGWQVQFTAAYDSRGTMIGMTNARGQSWTGVPDGAGRLSTKTYSTGLTLAYGWTDDGLLKSVSGGGTSLGYVYDAHRRMVSASDATLGKTVEYGYHDDTGLLASKKITGIDSTRVSFTYDGAKRLVNVASDGRSAVLGYDLAGRRTSTQLPNGVQTAYSFDNADRLVGVSHTKSGSTLSSATYALDAAGNRLRETYEDGSSAVYGYDLADRLAMESVPGVGTRYYAYSRAGDRVWEGGPAAFTQSWSDDFERAELGATYDLAGGEWALTASETDKELERLTADPTKASGPALVTNSTILKSGLVQVGGEVTPASGTAESPLTAGLVFAWTSTSNYWVAGVKSYSDAGQLHVKYLIAEVKDGEFTVMAESAEEEVLPAGTASVQLKLSVQRGAMELSRAYPGTPWALVLATGNSWTDGAMPLSRSGFYADRAAPDTAACRFDSLQVEWPESTLAGAVYTHNAMHQLLAVSGLDKDATYTYDADGNRASQTKGGVLTTYGYTFENRLLNVQVDGLTVRSYEYQGDGWQRRTATEDGVTTGFVHDGDDVFAEFDSNGVLAAHHVTNGIDKTLWSVRGGQFSTPLAGAQNVMAVADAVGTRTALFRYRAFGERITVSGPNPARTDPSFQGRTYDQGLGIYDYRNRSFDPATGRFLQRDPVLGGDPLFNPYCFPGNNPITGSDPMGTDKIEVRRTGKGQDSSSIVYWVTDDGNEYPLGEEVMIPLPKRPQSALSWLAGSAAKSLSIYAGNATAAPALSLGDNNGHLMLSRLRSVAESVHLDGIPPDDQIAIITGLVSYATAGLDFELIPDIGKSYMEKSWAQVLKGNYGTDDDVTLLGTGAQVALGLVGFDAPMDVRDVFHDVTHWQWTWGHAGKTALDAVGLVPAFGDVKYADEGWVLLKRLLRNTKKIKGSGDLPQIILRTTKSGEKVIDISRGGVRRLFDLIGGKLNLLHYEQHHIFFKVLGGSDEAANLVGIRAVLHRGKKIGLHQHIDKELGMGYEALAEAWKGAQKNPEARRAFMSKLRQAYSSYFEGSKDYDAIMSIIDRGLSTVR